MKYYKIKSWSLFLVVSFSFTLFSGLFLKNVYDLQFTNSEYFQEQALSYRIKSETLKAKRGSIYDKNLNPLATSSQAFNIGIYAPLSKGLDLGINLDYPFFLRSLVGVALSGKEQKIGFSENSNSKITIRYYILSASLIHFLNEFNSGTYLYTNLGLIKRTGYKSYWWNLGTILTLGIGQAFKFKTFTILPGIDYNKSFDSFLNVKVSFLF